MKYTLKAAAIAATTALTSLAPMGATAETLTFGTGNVIIHPVNQRVMIPWADKVNAEGGDAIQLRVRHGQMLVSSKNYTDRIADDVVQMTWGMLVFNPGRFPKSLVTTVPFVEGSAEAIAMSYCKLYEDGALGDELADYKPLIFVPFPQSSLHLDGGPLTKMSDIEGKKIMTGTPLTSEIVSAYGGTPLSTILPDHYPSLQRGTADGNIMTFTAFPAFKLDEVTTNHMTVPMGGAIGMVFMMRERYEALSPEARAVLDANSGCDVSRQMGAIVDQWEEDSYNYVKAKGTHTFAEIQPEDLQEMKDKLGAKVVASFTDRVEGGVELYEKWVATMAESNAEIGK